MDCKKALVNLGLLIIILGGGLLLLPKLFLAVMPFILGWFLSLVLDPPIRFLENKLRIKRKAGSVLVITFVIVLICTCFCFLIKILSQKAEQLFWFFPSFIENTRAQMVTLLIQWKNLTDDLPPILVEKTQEIVEIMGKQMKKEIEKVGILQITNVEDIAKKLPGKFLSLILILLSLCYFTIEEEKVKVRIEQSFPKKWKEKFNTIKETMGEVLGTYLKVQLKIELWIYLLLIIGFFILKIEYGFFIAIPIAVLDLFPVFGTGLILLPWTVFCLLGGNYMDALGLSLIWAGSLLVRQIIQPKIIGKSMGIGTFPSLILLYLGYRWAGLAGMFFAVPLANLILGMNEAGFFENSKLSIKILWTGIEHFRDFSVIGKKEEGKEKNEEKLQSGDSV